MLRAVAGVIESSLIKGREKKHLSACKGLEYLTQTGSVHRFRSPVQKLWKINVIYLHQRALNCLTLLPTPACFSLLRCLQSISSGWSWRKHFVDLQESAKNCLALFACPNASVTNPLLLTTPVPPQPWMGLGKEKGLNRTKGQVLQFKCRQD